MEPPVTCKVILVGPDGRLGSFPSQVFELPHFTHYLVDKKAVEKVKRLLIKSYRDLEVAREKGYADAVVSDIEGEINGIKYTLQALGISIKDIAS